MTLVLKNYKKSSVKHSIEKTILLDFGNLSRIFFPRLFEETYFHLTLDPDPLNLYSLQILVVRKTHLHLKLIFRATELQQRPEFDIFREELFCTLASSTNLVLTSFQLQRGSIYEEILLFLTENWSFLEFPCIFKELKTKREVFRESWTKHLQTFWYFSTVCPHHKWNRTRLLSPESGCKSCLTSCKII